jgi:hypothetical protein
MDNKDNQDISEIEDIIHAARISLSDERTKVLYLRAIVQTELLILKELRKPKV